MKKFSGGYIPVNPNFVMNDILGKNDNDITCGLVAIIKNILFRGCPAKPSELLSDKLGKRKTSYGGFWYYNENKLLLWDTTIKGRGLLNPALDFYRKVLKNNFPDDYFLFII